MPPRMTDKEKSLKPTQGPLTQRLEVSPHKREVAGSSPARPTKPLARIVRRGKGGYSEWLVTSQTCCPICHGQTGIQSRRRLKKKPSYGSAPHGLDWEWCAAGVGGDARTAKEELMDENTINRVVLEKITEEMETAYDVIDQPDIQRALIGQIYGITLLAKVLKEELKGE